MFRFTEPVIGLNKHSDNQILSYIDDIIRHNIGEIKPEEINQMIFDLMGFTGEFILRYKSNPDILEYYDYILEEFEPNSSEFINQLKVDELIAQINNFIATETPLHDVADFGGVQFVNETTDFSEAVDQLGSYIYYNITISKCNKLFDMNIKTIQLNLNEKIIALLILYNDILSEVVYECCATPEGRLVDGQYSLLG